MRVLFQELLWHPLNNSLIHVYYKKYIVRNLVLINSISNQPEHLTQPNRPLHVQS